MQLSDIVSKNIVVTQVQLEKDPELLKQIQTKLELVVDGIYGPNTKAAIAQFCKGEHLDNAATGKYGASFAEKLIKAVVLKTPVTRNDHIRLIIKECHKQGITNPNQVAYVLATTQHETAGKFQPIDEMGSAAYLEQYEWRSDLGNVKEGDAQKYKGRGYTQITGRRNYTKYAALTGKDLVNHPELAKEPYTAAFIMVHGFRFGGFTGLTIHAYINNRTCDFVNARRCINSTDRAQLIAGYAKSWVSQLGAYDGLA